MSERELTKGVQVIQIVKVGGQFSITCHGSLNVAETIAAMEKLKLELLTKSATPLARSELNLKVRQMP